MPIQVSKSPAHLTFEIEKIRKELASLWGNWDKKKKITGTTLVGYRAGLQELDAVLAATETGYSAYLNLLSPFLILAQAGNGGGADPKGEDTWFFDTAGVEAARVERAREVHRDQRAGIQRQSQSLYRALQTEEKQVRDYDVHLNQLLAEKTDQYQVLIKTYGPGL